MKRVHKREESLRDEFEEGFTLIEAMVSFIIMTVLFLISISAIGTIRERSASEAVVTTFQAITSEARSRAMIQNAMFGIVFVEGGDRVCARLYKDGDGDGVRRDDILRGKDLPVSPPEPIVNQFSNIAIPFGARRDPSGNSLSGADAIRFGSGDILSFSPKATATPGTLYLSEGIAGENGWAIRVAGIDGRIRIYRFKNGKWAEVCRW